MYSHEIKSKQEKNNELTEEQIFLHIQTIKAAIKVLHDDIRTIKQSFPFTIENELKTEDWIKEQVQITETELVKLEAYERELLVELQQLLQ